MNRRVVITGLGAVGPVGLDARTSFEALVNGRSGIGPLSTVVDGMQVQFGGEVTGFAAPMLTEPSSQPSGRFAQFALAAAREALRDAELSSGVYPPHRVAVLLGVGLGAVDLVQDSYRAFLERGADAIDPRCLDSIAPTRATELVAEELDAGACTECLVSACASSAHAIGESFELIRSGAVDAVVSGGAEAGITPLGVSIFDRIGALSHYAGPPQRACRPFDRDRDGFVIAEGGAIVVLEELQSARRRGARVYAEIAGYGASADAFHLTKPPQDGAGMRRAMGLALESASTHPDEVEYVNAHGTGTPYNDAAETLAIKSLFGNHARSLWISSTKSMTGHLLGAAAALETVATAYSLARGVVPPTINLDNPDPLCDLDYVPWQARERRLRVVLNNSFGFGGQNASLLLKAL